MAEPGVLADSVWKKFRRGEPHDGLRDLVPAAISGTFQRRHAQSRLVPQEFWAVRDISFAVHPGESLGIIGPNGAGKSTILKLLARILRPTKGRCVVRGRVGALIEATADRHPDLTGRESVFVQGALMGLRRAEISAKFDEIVEFSGVSEFIDTSVKRYSAGMSARLRLAIATHLEPDVLLVDEVLSAGDARLQEQCVARMRELLARGVSLVFVSHNLPAVVELCTRTLVVNHGSVMFEGDPASAIREYRQAAWARPGKQAAKAQGDVHISGVELLDGSWAPAAVFRTGRPITVRIRYHASRPVVKPHFAIDIYRADGVYCGGINTRMDRKSFATLAGDGQVDLSVDGPRLLPGSYVLSAGILDAHGARTLDVHHRAYPFSIASERSAFGLVHLDRHWLQQEICD